MSTAPVPSWSQELRTLWVLAWPVVLGQLGIMGFGVADVVMAGQVGEAVLAGVSVGHIWAFGVLVVALGTLRGLDPVFSQGHGAEDEELLARTLAQGLVLAGIIAVPCMGLMLLAEPVLVLLDQPPEVVPEAAMYCRISALGVLPVLVVQVGTQLLQGRGIMRPAMWVVLVMNVVNIVLNGVFMLGWGGGWQLGAVGCSVSTTLGRWLMPVLLLAFAWGPITACWPQRSHWIDRARLKKLLRLGLPVGGQHFLEVWGFNATGIMVGWLGATQIAGHTIAMTMVSVTFMVPFGVSAAASTRVGNLVGAGKPWQRGAGASLMVGAGFMACTMVVLFTVPELFVGAFTGDPPVAAVALLVLPLAATFQLFDGVQIVANGVLRGLGDVDFPAIAHLVGFWVLGLPLGYVLGIQRGGGITGVWAALVVGLVVAAAMMLARVMWRMRVGPVLRA